MITEENGMFEHGNFDTWQRFCTLIGQALILIGLEQSRARHPCTYYLLKNLHDGTDDGYLFQYKKTSVIN